MATLKIKNGVIATRSGIIATSCAPSGPTCNQLTGVLGPQECYCAGASRFAVCLNGFTGDDAGLNNNALPWMLDRTGGSGSSGTYSTSSGNLAVILQVYNSPAGPGGEWLEPGDWRGRSYTLTAYRNGAAVYTVKGSDWDWVGDCETPGLSLAGCSGGWTVRGITFKIAAQNDWFPRQVRLTISGATMCGQNCTGATGGNFSYKVLSANLNGVYILDIDEQELARTPNSAVYWNHSAGSYSYYVGDGNCANGYVRSGVYRLLVTLSSGSVYIRLSQKDHPAAGAGDDLYAWGEWDVRCNEASGGGSDIHTCPRAYGSFSDAWVKTVSGGQATVVAV